MATTLPHQWTLSDAYTAAQSLQAAAIDDVVAMAVLAILSAVYLVRGTLWDRPDPHLYKMYERPQEKMGSNSVTTVSRDVSERMQQVVSHLSASCCWIFTYHLEERRHCCLLGLSIRHCGKVCRSIGKRDQATLRHDGTRRGHVGFRIRLCRAHSAVEAGHLHHVDFWRR